MQIKTNDKANPEGLSMISAKAFPRDLLRKFMSIGLYPYRATLYGTSIPTQEHLFYGMDSDGVYYGTTVANNDFAKWVNEQP